MKLIFVKSEEFKEFEEDLKYCLYLIKTNTLKILAVSILFYLTVCALIIVL